MAVTVEDILSRGKRIGMVSGIPAIDSSLQGAPVTVPGSGMSNDKTKKEGAPVQSAKVAPAVTSEIAGAPNAGQVAAVPDGASWTRSIERGRVALPTEIPTEYKASSYAELIPQLEEHVRSYKPMTKEQLEKLRKRHKAEGIMSGISDAVRSIANLISVHNYAPDMFEADKSMTERARQRFEKEKAEREEKDNKWFNDVLTLAKLKDLDRKYGLDAWLSEQNMRRQERAYNDARDDKDADNAFREKEYKRKEQWHKEEEPIRKARQKALESQADKNNRYVPGGRGGGKEKEYITWRINPETGKKEYHKSGSEAAARNFAQTHRNEGWVYDTTEKRTTTNKPNAYGENQTSESVSNVSSGKVTINWE